MESRSIDFGETVVTLRTSGAGQPIFYIHDELSSDWNVFLEKLAGDASVTALELPGYGETARPDHIETVDDLGFFVGDVIQEIADGQPTAIVGSSVGGWIAIETAVRAVHLISQLVVIGAPGFEVDGEVPTDHFVMTPDERAAVLFEDPAKEPKVEEDPWIRNSSMTGRLVWQPRYTSPKLKNRVSRLNQPSLVIWGENDRLLSRRYGEEVAQRLGGKFDVIGTSGHFPVWESPEETAQKVGDFLSSNRG